jgi:hypothetical protein
MEGTQTIDWIALAMPGVAALSCFIAVSALAGLIRSNKGAKINWTWGLLAFGTACFGLASLDKVLQLLDLPNAAPVRDGLMGVGGILIVIASFYGRGLYRDLLK